MSEIIINLLSHKSKMRRISNAKGGEWCGPCPVCGGDDRFRCWPSQPGAHTAQKAGISGSWWCRKCDSGGDVIDLLMFMDKLTFPEACRRLRIEISDSAKIRRPLAQPPKPEKWSPISWNIPSANWRQHATKLVNAAAEKIKSMPQVLKYLASRGLPAAAVELYGLGYVEGEGKKGTGIFRARSAFDLKPKTVKDGTQKKTLWLPRGIAIPAWLPASDNIKEIFRLRIRRQKSDIKPGDSKYILLEGSGQAPLLLPPAAMAPPLATWVIVESELDAYATHYACGGVVGVMAALTNLGKPDIAAHKWLTEAKRILVALDYDPPDSHGRRPGAQGWKWWKEHYSQARRWPVPAGKDPGEAFTAGFDLSEWIRAAGSMPDPRVSLPVAGRMGDRDFESQSLEEGKKTQPPQFVNSAGKKRWAKALPGVSIEDVELPPKSVSKNELLTYYSEKSFASDLLIPCPKSTPPWLWGYISSCEACPGHSLCLYDYIESLTIKKLKDR